MTLKTKKLAVGPTTIDLGLGGMLPEPDNSDDSVPVRVLREIQPIGAASAELIQDGDAPSISTASDMRLPKTQYGVLVDDAVDGALAQQLEGCLVDFGIMGVTADELFQAGIEELNRSVLHTCRAGLAFWAAQEALKNTKSAAADSDEMDGVRDGGLGTFKDWMDSNGLSKQRVYEAIAMAKFFVRLSQPQRSKMLKVGKKQVLLLATLHQDVIDQAAENGKDILDEAETLSYDQLREHLRSTEQRNKRLESEIDHRDAVIAKMKQRNPVYQFSPQVHFVREECLVHQAECELALNSLWAMFEETANEEETSPEHRMRLEQIWITAHVAAARAIDTLNKIKDCAPVPVGSLPDCVGSIHSLTDEEATTWILDYQLIERKHFAAKAEREKKRQDNLPKGPGRPKKEG